MKEMRHAMMPQSNTRTLVLYVFLVVTGLAVGDCQVSTSAVESDETCFVTATCSRSGGDQTHTTVGWRQITGMKCPAQRTNNEAGFTGQFKGQKEEVRLTGEKGSMGGLGQKGAMGETGLQGPKGDAGSMGTQGYKGEVEQKPVFDTLQAELDYLRNEFEVSLGIRLVDGRGINSGRVEILHDGVWGTICDDRWDIREGNVVCRMLGYTRASSAPGSARFGKGTGKIWLDSVDCVGSEDHINSCSKGPWLEQVGRSVGCGHGRDVSVICI